MAHPTPRVRFGEFELDARAAQLRSGGSVLNISGQPFRILELLVERSGEVVTREEIRSSLWADDHNVDFDAAINVGIRRIREVLGETADAPVHLHTVRGRGYRFELGETAEPAQDAEAPTYEPPPLSPPPAQPRAEPARERRYWPWAGTLLLVILLVGLVARSRQSPQAPKGITQFSHSGSVTAAAISGDGMQVAYVDAEGGQNVLHVCGIKGEDCRIIMRGLQGVAKLLFSADGQFLFLGCFEGPFPGSNIVRIPVAGGPPTIVVRSSAWLSGVSRDGRRVLYLRDRETESTLQVIDITDGSERTLVRRLRPDRLTAAAWSADEDTVACWWLVANNAGFYHSLLTASVSGGTEKLLSAGPWPAEYPRPDLAWLANGKALVTAIKDQESGRRQIYRVDFPSGSVERVTNELSSFAQLGVTGDSQSLVTVKDDTAPQIWVVDPGHAGTSAQITTGAPGYSDPSWSTKGIVAKGSDGLWLINPSSGKRQPIPGTLGSDWRPAGDPGGDTVFFEAKRRDGHAVWNIGVDGSGLKQIVREGSAGRPKVSKDGRWLFFSAFAPEFISVYRVPTGGGDATRLTSDGPVTDPDVSPDGKWLAAMVARAPIVKIYPASGGNPIKKISLPREASPDAFSWSPDGRAITFLRDSLGVTNVWKIPVEGGDAVPITDFKTHSILNFCWLPDGRLAVTRAERSADVVVIRNFRGT